MNDIRYMAGFFDGEGCIGIYHHGGHPDPRYKSGISSPSWVRMVIVTNTNRSLLTSFKQRYGGRIKETCPNIGTKPIFDWIIGARRDITRFLTALYPHLRGKKKQARVMLRECNGTISTEEAAKCLKQLK